MVVFAFAVLCGGCASRYDRPPKTEMIEQAFFVCPKCGSLRGGVFGKGPTKRFQTAIAPHCVHDWRRVSRDEFKGIAARRFDVDWSKEKSINTPEHALEACPGIVEFQLAVRLEREIWDLIPEGDPLRK